MIRRAALLCPLTLVAAGCASSTARTTAIAPESSCVLVAPPTAPAQSVAVATTATADPAHVPVPQNRAERFAFAQSYETLINADCDGRAIPGLARSWTTDVSRTRLTLVLREGARFWDGEPLRAREVVAAWRTTADTPSDWSQLARRLADAATIVDDRTLIVSLPDTQSIVLAHPALAIYRRSPGSTWAEGTGPFRATDSPAGAEPGVLALAPVPPHTGPTLTIRARRDADARDAIDAGADLLATADPTVLSYAATRPELATVPLPWDRTYLLVVPGGGATATAMPLGGDSTAFRASLARDAVRSEARAAEPPFWWSDAGGCALQNPNDPPPSGGQRSARVVYQRDDRVARQLAERLVALGGHMIAEGLSPGELSGALRAGNDLAYVLELPRRSLARCQDLARIRQEVPWLGTATLTALIDTRSRAIVRRDRVSATADWDGTVRVIAAPAAMREGRP